MDGGADAVSGLGLEVGWLDQRDTGPVGGVGDRAGQWVFAGLVDARSGLQHPIRCHPVVR